MLACPRSDRRLLSTTASCGDTTTVVVASIASYKSRSARRGGKCYVVTMGVCRVRIWQACKLPRHDGKWESVGVMRLWVSPASV